MPPPIPQPQVEQILELQRRCWGVGRIAAEVGVTRQAVAKYLRLHNARVLERIERRSAAARGRQLERLEWIAEQAALA
jgi:hypothetical protein